MQTVTQPASGGSSAVDTQVQNHNIRIERKHFTFELKENPRGKFLRITEEVNSRYDAIIVPLTGIEQFRDTLNEVIKLSKNQPTNL
jgi:predicted ATP-grasp superfamily ATP-dependent carboligase